MAVPRFAWLPKSRADPPYSFILATTRLSVLQATTNDELRAPRPFPEMSGTISSEYLPREDLSYVA